MVLDYRVEIIIQMKNYRSIITISRDNNKMVIKDYPNGNTDSKEDGERGY